MRNSLKLGAVSGIPIGLHWSIALIAGLFGLTLAGTILPSAAAGYASAAYLVTAAVVTAALLASIIAHELGHSLVAQNNNIGVSGITLFALGGVARLEREPDDAGAAARIALAGPAVSVAIGVVALGLGLTAGTLGVSSLVVAGLTWLGLVNLTLAVFNMLPALPLDGGRVLQAALWKRSGDRDRATLSAASVGRYIGWAVVTFGFWQFLNGAGGLWTIVIGWFIVSSARAEALRARFVLHRRNWAPPVWWQRRDPVDNQTGPFGSPTGPFGAQDNPFGSQDSQFGSRAGRFGTRAGDVDLRTPPAPRAQDRIVEVDGHRVG